MGRAMFSSSALLLLMLGLGSAVEDLGGAVPTEDGAIPDLAFGAQVARRRAATLLSGALEAAPTASAALAPHSARAPRRLRSRW